ncbi:hypothetical protein [Nocardia suismassiliense]|uniref:hypothetical protein n=1 Tax=Nocardia suismassiliense TaxID=2077092 RepID=UPI00131ED67E|nr:hypothetical protein [Nocardia suismassiliense]
MHPDGRIEYGYRNRLPLLLEVQHRLASAVGVERLPLDQVRDYMLTTPIPNLWVINVHRPELPANPLATAILRHLDPEPYTLDQDWRGPITLITIPNLEHPSSKLPRAVHELLTAWQDHIQAANISPEALAHVDSLIDAQLAAGDLNWSTASPEEQQHLLDTPGNASRAARATASTTVTVDASDLSEAQDPIALATYLAANGWHHTTMAHIGDGQTAFWRAGTVPEQIVALAFAEPGPQVDEVHAHVIDELAASEGRDRDHIVADILATASRPLTPAAALPGAGLSMLETRMRVDYLEYHEHRRSEDSRRLSRAWEIEQQWLTEHGEQWAAQWRALRQITMGWQQRPEMMAQLHAGLTAYAGASDPIMIRHHEQAATLVGRRNDLLTTTDATAQIVADTAAIAETASTAVDLSTPTDPNEQLIVAMLSYVPPASLREAGEAEAFTTIDAAKEWAETLLGEDVSRHGSGWDFRVELAHITRADWDTDTWEVVSHRLAYALWDSSTDAITWHTGDPDTAHLAPSAETILLGAPGHPRAPHDWDRPPIVFTLRYGAGGDLEVGHTTELALTTTDPNELHIHLPDLAEQLAAQETSDNPAGALGIRLDTHTTPDGENTTAADQSIEVSWCVIADADGTVFHGLHYRDDPGHIHPADNDGRLTDLVDTLISCAAHLDDIYDRGDPEDTVAADSAALAAIARTRPAIGPTTAHPTTEPEIFPPTTETVDATAGPDL